MRLTLKTLCSAKQAVAALVALTALAPVGAAADAQPLPTESVPPAAAEAQPAPAEAATLASDAVSAPATSFEVAQLTSWIVSSHDNGDLPFAVIDKVGAQILLFDAAGQLLGDAPVLVGITKGDDSTPGVGDRELSHIPVADRTTPAGRFLAKFGWASGRKKVLWIDYHDAISLHPVITSNPKEHRLARLNSATPDDNRITFGCINVPKAFYGKVVQPVFAGHGGMVYILPETKPLNEVFAALPVQTAAANTPPVSQ